MKRAGRLVEISIRHRRLKADRKGLAAAIAVLDANAAKFTGGCPPGELSVALMSDEALAGLHRRYLGDRAPTDVITFEGDPGHGLAGEICVSVDAAVHNAGRSQAKLSRELTLYVVHGWLHLAGYDDEEPGDRQSMRRAESRALLLLKRSEAIPRFKLA